MEEKELLELLEAVKKGETNVQDAVLKLRQAPFEDMGFARPDTHRGLRQGAAEVIFGQGKTPEQNLMIAEKLLEKGQKSVLITRMSQEAANYFTDNKKKRD